MALRDTLCLEGCLLLLWLVAGCATPDSVVLLQSTGDNPAVTVESTQGSETLTRPREGVEFRKAEFLTRTTTPVEVRERFGQVLDATPAPSRHYVIQFATGESALPLRGRQSRRGAVGGRRGASHLRSGDHRAYGSRREHRG